MPRRGLACNDRYMRQAVLIVDDHAGFHGCVRRLLDAGGCAVVDEAGDRVAALGRAAATGFLRVDEITRGGLVALAGSSP